jgi:hypothetical protein
MFASLGETPGAWVTTTCTRFLHSTYIHFRSDQSAKEIKNTSSIPTIVDLLEEGGVSWAGYYENLPTDGSGVVRQGIFTYFDICCLIRGH